MQVEKYKTTASMASVNPDQGVGYPLELFKDQERAKKYTCPICEKIVKSPVQIHTEVPQLACSSCYKKNRR